ncbi:MAG: GNAT family N-acetyltransferase [Pseudomonadota bacterium]
MISVRPARPEDVPALAEIGLAAWRKGIGPLVSADIAARIETSNPFVPFLEDRGPGVLVGERDGTLAGFGASEDADTHISDLWVSPMHEGCGVARAIVSALEKTLLQAGHTHASISVAVGNDRALALYLHLGYLEVWRGSRHDPALDTILEQVDLEKSLVKGSRAP